MPSPRRILHRFGLGGARYPGVARWTSQPPKVPVCPPGWRIGPPDFVGVGAQKAGTTWWYALIAAHPDVHHDPRQRPELHYWDRFSQTWPTSADVETYHRLFARPPSKMMGEKTPEYMIDYWVPAMIREAAPDVRIIVLLRDPIERYRSAASHGLESGWRRDRLTETTVFNIGLYNAQLARLRELFAPDRLLILQYERCVREPQAQLNRTYQFLGLSEQTLAERVLREPRNASRGPAPTIDSRRLAVLRSAYEPDVRLVRDAVPDLDLALWPNFAQLD